MAAPESELRELKKITDELRDINENTGSFWGYFLRGVLSGGGAIVGGVLTVLLIGYVLSIIGVIPGFQTIAGDINAALANTPH